MGSPESDDMNLATQREKNSSTKSGPEANKISLKLSSGDDHQTCVHTFH